MKRRPLITALGAAAVLAAAIGGIAAVMTSGAADRVWSLLAGTGKSAAAKAVT